MIALIGCGSEKLEVRAAAKDLYTGTLFRDRRAYAEEHAQCWFIVSALYGLVTPEALIEPYDLHITSFSKIDRQQVMAKVVDALEASKAAARAETPVELHMGSAYAEPLLAEVERRGFGGYVTWPVKGLELGKLRSWYRARRGAVRRGGA